MSNLRRALVTIVALTLVALPSACSSSSSSSQAKSSTTAHVATIMAAQKPITIVVTNDDGIGAPGIDELARQLKALPDVTIKVVAPATNQSGKGDLTTPGTVKYHDATTQSGIQGIAVEGTPADSVNVAVKVLELKPDVIASGINLGQNVGPLAKISGTVGAAITAVRLGIPGVAGSAGIIAHPSYAAAAKDVANWIEANRTAIASHKMVATDVVNFNVPECTSGTPHPLVKVPTAAAIPKGANPFSADCAATKATYVPTDDVDALVHGFAAQSDVSAK